MAEYFATKDKDVYLKYDPESNTKQGRLQELDKVDLTAEKEMLFAKKADLPDGTDEKDLLAWAVDNWVGSPDYLLRMDIDARITEIDADLEAMK